ncbi:hypothetical protein GS506_10400 [Rhodococcus hoagii]|nr:hypothetical protein [Prescottella equi]
MGGWILSVLRARRPADDDVDPGSGWASLLPLEGLAPSDPAGQSRRRRVGVLLPCGCCFSSSFVSSWLQP